MDSQDHEQMRFLLKNRIPINSDHYLMRKPYLYKTRPRTFPWVRVLVIVAIVAAVVAWWLGNLNPTEIETKLLYPWK